MNTELIAAILKLAAAQEAIATQLGRIADQITPSEDQTKYPGTAVDFIAAAISDSAPDLSDSLDKIAGAISDKD